MSEELSFIQSLGEARMFKSRNQLEKEGARSLTDHLFVSLLALYAMSNDYKYAISIVQALVALICIRQSLGYNVQKKCSSKNVIRC